MMSECAPKNIPVAPITIPKALKASPRPTKDTPESRMKSGIMTPKAPKPEDVKKFIAYNASIADLLLVDSTSIVFLLPSIAHSRARMLATQSPQIKMYTHI
jgi:hypothetical protein